MKKLTVSLFTTIAIILLSGACAANTGVDLDNRTNRAIAVPLTGYTHTDAGTDWTGPNAPSHTTKGDLDVIGPVPPSLIEFVTQDYRAQIASVADVSMAGVELTMPDGTTLKIAEFQTDRSTPINAFSAAFAQAWLAAVLRGVEANEAAMLAVMEAVTAAIKAAGPMIP